MSQQSGKYQENVSPDENKVKVAVIEGPEEAFVDPNQPPVPAKRRNSSKSAKSLSRNRVFPQKLPPIRKTKSVRKLSKFKSGMLIS